MIREATAMTVRQNLGELLNEVQYRQDAILVTKGGKPVAAIVDIALFERIRNMRAEFDRLSSEIAQAYQGTSEAEGLAEIDAIVKRGRRKAASLAAKA
ncbi:MAG: type II toxin-antitoxin system prevent-host-death family antitoxin [Burkholderiales bacterium]|nr:type II toxin-antitoxin system prevent-host-death family antitoxin [Burkholderiales bacterium]